MPLLASNPASGSGLCDGVGPRTVAVDVDAMDGIAARSILLAEASRHPGPSRTGAPLLHIFSGTDAAAVLRSLDAGTESDDGPARLVIAADGNDQLQQRITRARRHIEDGHPPGEGVRFQLQPLDGELAFVFTAAGAAYSGMGAQLLRAIPETTDSVAESFPLGETASWVFGDPLHEPTPSDFLWGASMLSSSHTYLTRHVLALKPTAAIGYSSGESNSLFSFGIWSDRAAMRAEIDASGMMDRELGVDFTAVARAWGETSATWAMWNVLAPIDDVRTAIADEDRVHLAIINTANDSVIGGESDACERVIESLGRRRCRLVPYNLACHVPEVRDAFHQPWLDIHTRAVTPMHRRAALLQRHERRLRGQYGRVLPRRSHTRRSTPSTSPPPSKPRMPTASASSSNTARPGPVPTSSPRYSVIVITWRSNSTDATRTSSRSSRSPRRSSLRG